MKKLPGPDHPITVEPSAAHVVVRLGDTVVADTRASLALRESTYPVVHYVPYADVDWSKLERTATSTFCPYKGDASYWSVTTGAATAPDAVWSYEEPYEAVARIAGHVAFYPNRVDVSVREG